MKKKNGGAELPRKSNSETKSGQKSKRAKARGPVQRDSKEVMAELVAKLTERLGSKPVPANATEVKPQGALAPNRDRLTVGVDLGDQWSNYCILGLEGETLAEGQLRTTQQDVTEFFQALSTARVIIEVGTHSAWVREVVVGCGHEVLVANPRLMDGTRRRKRKNDRVDANNLARVGRIDPQSLFPIEHRSTEVRQDLVVLRARDALVAVRTQLIKVREWLSRIDKDSKDARNKRIFDMWLSCHTDADIAGAVDLSEEGVRKITQQMAELPEVGKPPASHLSDFEIPLYNVWKQQEKTAGAGHFGNSEVRWVDNLLYLYTRPFDIVVDPFGGGGSTIDVCKKRYRRYWVGDRKPVPERAHQIREHDLTAGLPGLPRWQDVKLVYLDPPYWKQAEGQYSEDPTDLANMSLEEFNKALAGIFNGFAKKLSPGAVIAL